MFKRKPKTPDASPLPPETSAKKRNWLRISIYVNIALIVLIGVGLGVMEVVQQSNTNPSLCGLCHIMQPKVSSYLTSNHLDHVHEQAGVACKNCHDYPLSAEISSGVNYVIGNYTVDASGNLFQRKFDNDMCLKCHISYKHVAELTDFLQRNPHYSHNGELDCSTCHVSHGAQIDYCSQCHENGGQRMVDQPVTGRGTISTTP